MLTRLSLSGFKSFADKAVLEFPRGVSVIVGPNGSGKSNVVDAFRWLLGERDAAHLRGAKIEDLVFAGTSLRSRVGLAQASLVLDNSDNAWPLQFPEIQIKRQVSRDGESHYFINENEVRLRDVQDFFAKSRIGNRGLTLVGQGNSDSFVRVSNLERRLMMEEVLGFKDYRNKKNESEARLKTTKENLERINSLLREMEPRLRILRKQTSEWEKRDELLKELRILENQFFGYELRTIERGAKEVELEIDVLKAALEKEWHRVHLHEKTLRGIEDERPEVHRNMSDLLKAKEILMRKQALIERELGRLEARIELMGKDQEIKAEDAHVLIHESRRALETALNESTMHGIQRVIKTILLEIEHALYKEPRVDSKGILNAKKKYEETIAGLEAELEAIQEKEKEYNALLINFNTRVREAVREAENARLFHTRLLDKERTVLIEKARWGYKHKEICGHLAQVGRNIDEIDTTIMHEPLSSALFQRMHALRNELARIGAVEESIIKEANELESKYMDLAREAHDLHDASGDLSVLIEDLTKKLSRDFVKKMNAVSVAFDRYCNHMFGGGKARLLMDEGEENAIAGIRAEVDLPRKKTQGLESLSGGERSLVSLAALFSMIAVNPPPFLILDEVDAALDEKNARRFAGVLRDLSLKTQFVVVTHNRSTMEAAHVLYGVTMDKDGTSRILSLRLE